jgi:TetR/AcrR family transcriptional repressor of nem operon
VKVSKEQAQATRRKIVEKAAELFRVRGFEGIGVADLMKASGMTHGGFYRHFRSKDDLVREASAAAYEQLERDTEGKSVEALLARYISTDHRDDLASGCPTSALGGDALRQPGPVREVFAKGVETWLGMIGEALEPEEHLDPERRRALSIDLAARAVGAVILARATASEPALSEEIIRKALEAGLADARTG